MTDYIHQLVSSIFQKDSLDQCSLQELEQYVDRHPYFGAAQLLLAKKMQTDSPDKYPEQLEKTFQYFHNPLWVQHLLNADGGIEIEKGKLPVPGISTAIDEIKTDITTVYTNPETEDISSTGKLEPDNKIASIENEYPSDEAIEKDMNENVEIETTGPVIQIPGLKIEPIDPAKADLHFQPYHTVDYFASQGIKLSEEVNTPDKFGKQLKSFTDWLKTMRKLSSSEMETHALAGNTQKVDQLAEDSIREGVVETESMARVWEKQGNPLKAIEIYRKLSLLEPSKSVYFAAKIEELKKLT